jgi:hypothetical protein
MKKKIAIFDLDNCLSDDSRRLHLLPVPGSCCEAYEEYHSDCGNDPVLNRNLILEHIAKDDFVLFITARPDKYRETTLQWIYSNFPLIEMEISHHLLMRKFGDSRPSPILKVELLSEFLRLYSLGPEDVIAAYDDRGDVLAAYREFGVSCVFQADSEGCRPYDQLPPSKPPAVPEILREMATTFEERNRVYGSNYRMVGPMMKVLFPDGVPPQVLHSDQFHLFELKLVKLSRFAISNLTHLDSIHDDAVYSAMIESILLTEERN